jgi:hypothetical protein
MRVLRGSGLAFVILVCLAALGCGKSADAGSAPNSQRVSSAAPTAGSGHQPEGTSGQNAGRGSSGASAPDPGRQGPGAPGAPVAPGGRSKPGQAIGAPIKIPSIITDQGRPLAEVRSEIESGIREQCGGELCVTLRDEARDGSAYTSCQFWETDPPQGTSVDRGTTVVVVSGTEPCTTESSVDTEPPATTPESSEPSPTTPQDSQPPPST